jgi:hypothetical protein
MKYKLVNREEYANLLEEVANLRKLVDALCVGMCDLPTDEEELKVHLSGRSSARSHGWRKMRTLAARNILRELEGQRQTLIEDFPDLMVKP